MISIIVESPGLLTTVQDLGRDGFGPLGLSPSGAADALSLRLGNRLVDNPESAAALEMTLVGGTFRFPEGATIALTGSDFGATLDSLPLKLWTSIKIRPEQTLRVGPTRSGARCYLCLHGAILAEPFLGSASTHLLSGLGGWEGRALRKGDILPVDTRASQFREKSIALDALDALFPRKCFRVTAGPQSDWFSESARRPFYESTYRVKEESNRVGIRLEGPAIAKSTNREMITEGVALGAIQIPPDGSPIILFVEQQTTGGYPKIANLIAADLHRAGQLRPRDEIRFECVEMETARALWQEQERLLASPQLIQS